MKHVIGLEENQFIYLKGAKSGKMLTAGKFALGDIPPGAVRGGTIADMDAFCEALTAFAEKEQFKGKKVSLVLPGEIATFRELILPLPSKEKELKSMVDNEMFYYSESETGYTIEYLTVEKDEANRQCRVVALALSNRALSDYLEALGRCSLRPELVDVSYNTLGKLTKLCYPGEQLYVLLSVNPSTIDLRLIEDGICVLSRNVRLNLGNFKSLGTIDIVADEVADHVNRVLQFNSGRHRMEVSKLLILAPLDLSGDLASMLGERLALPCEVFASERIKTAKGLEEAPVWQMGCALGSLLRRK